MKNVMKFLAANLFILLLVFSEVFVVAMALVGFGYFFFKATPIVPYWWIGMSIATVIGYFSFLIDANKKRKEQMSKVKETLNKEIKK